MTTEWADFLTRPAAIVNECHPARWLGNTAQSVIGTVLQ
jgi:hypothetical protein